MNRLEQIEALFHQAVALPALADRQAWLEERCRDDAETLREVLGLLESHQAIAQPEAGEPAGQPTVPTALFGAYRAVELIGRGGMSAVYRAQRADGHFEQTVALKIMAGYLAGPEFLRRFEVERQLLATLSHNHITRLLDGGVSSAGDPYLITEYVEGETIDRFCDQQKLDIQARLRIFLQVCEAVDHAHCHQIIHRDLKPGNILVDATGSAKLLDFGTAALTVAGEITLTNMRMLTPRYASPEQLRGQRVGVATDVFSLGVVLYELVTGAWPYGDPGSALSELSRAVGDAPVRTPTSVLTAQAAGNRSVPVERLRHIVRGDLSAILLKALEEDPARRYESVSRFAADVRSFLEQRPVLARPRTAWYRASKFSRRHRVAVTAATLLLLFAVASTAFLYQVRLRNREKKRQAEGLAQIVSQASGMIMDHVHKSQLELAREETLNLRGSLEQVRRDNPDNPVILNLLAGSYLQLGELAWFRYGPSLMDADLALDSYRRARALFETVDRLDPSKIAFQQSIATRMYEGDMLIEDGHGVEAFSEAVKLLRDDEARVGRGDLMEIANLASYYDMLSDRLGGNMAWPAQAGEGAPGWYATVAALRPYRMTDAIALQIYQAALNGGSGENRAALPDSSRATISFQVGRLQHQTGLREQGRQSLQDALHVYLEGQQDTLQSSNVLSHIAGVHNQLSRAAEAEGKFPEALQEREEAVAFPEKQFAQQPQSLYLKEKVGASRLASARLLTRLGRRAEALRDGREGLKFLTENAGRTRASALTLDLAAQRLLTVEPDELRDPARAREYARRAVDQTAARMPPYLVTLAFAELALGHKEEARGAAILAVQGYQKITQILKPLFDGGKYPEAANLYREWQSQLGKVGELR